MKKLFVVMLVVIGWATLCHAKETPKSEQLYLTTCEDWLAFDKKVVARTEETGMSKVDLATFAEMFKLFYVQGIIDTYQSVALASTDDEYDERYSYPFDFSVYVDKVSEYCLIPDVNPRTTYVPIVIMIVNAQMKEEQL